ncbi:MAG: hypothetical protein KDA88_23855 [Planctomycetaceae bacterium]|nr:hypothetical protein [Planctomycetaceae bacterium]MCB9952150.1 hypothetical protein [Planctomycetaceae bacterium]
MNSQPSASEIDFDSMIQFEAGELSDDAVIDLFQRLINSGAVWRLQGFYGRFARDLIDNGYCTLPKEHPFPTES